MHLVKEPVIRAAYQFAKEFGWTLPQINALTPAQMEVFRMMIKSDSKST